MAVAVTDGAPASKAASPGPRCFQTSPAAAGFLLVGRFSSPYDVKLATGQRFLIATKVDEANMAAPLSILLKTWGFGDGKIELSVRQTSRLSN